MMRIVFVLLCLLFACLFCNSKSVNMAKSNIFSGDFDNPEKIKSIRPAINPAFSIENHVSRMQRTSMLYSNIKQLESSRAEENIFTTVLRTDAFLSIQCCISVYALFNTLILQFVPHQMRPKVRMQSLGVFILSNFMDAYQRIDISSLENIQSIDDDVLSDMRKKVQHIMIGREFRLIAYCCLAFLCGASNGSMLPLIVGDIPFILRMGMILLQKVDLPAHGWVESIARMTGLTHVDPVDELPRGSNANEYNVNEVSQESIEPSQNVIDTLSSVIAIVLEFLYVFRAFASFVLDFKTARVTGLFGALRRLLCMLLIGQYVLVRLQSLAPTVAFNPIDMESWRILLADVEKTVISSQAFSSMRGLLSETQLNFLREKFTALHTMISLLIQHFGLTSVGKLSPPKKAKKKMKKNKKKVVDVSFSNDEEENAQSSSSSSISCSPCIISGSDGSGTSGSNSSSSRRKSHKSPSKTDKDVSKDS